MAQTQLKQSPESLSVGHFEDPSCFTYVHIYVHIHTYTHTYTYTYLATLNLQSQLEDSQKCSVTNDAASYEACITWALKAGKAMAQNIKEKPQKQAFCTLARSSYCAPRHTH